MRNSGIRILWSPEQTPPEGLDSHGVARLSKIPLLLAPDPDTTGVPGANDHPWDQH